MPALPVWFPSDHRLTAMVVVLLTLAVAFSGSFGGAASNRDRERLAAVAALPTDTPAAPPSATQPSAESTAAPTAPPPTLVPGLNLTPPAQAVGGLDEGAILPRYRILSFYGHPNDPNMGIVGEHDMEELLRRLRQEQAAYEAADASRPIKPAFEVIASVAQDWPADDDTYLLHTGRDILDAYAQFAEQNDLLLILDIQVGHSTIEAEIDRIRPWLKLPYVHLAIDPEFSMADGEIPGQAIGGIDASDITYAQKTLAKLVAQRGLPPKVLIVHQFEERMIRDAESLAPMEGVQLVIEFDGFGEPSNKIAGYNLFITQRPIEFGGIKLFYRQDDPLLMPREIVALTPSPDLVIYQ